MTYDKYRYLVLIVWLLLFAVHPVLDKANGSSQSEQTQPKYTVQVGSYKKESDAKNELKRLQSFGIKAFIRHEAVKNKGMWYRLYAALFLNRAAAKNLAQDLMKKKIISGFWVKKIAPPFPDFIDGKKIEKEPVVAEGKEAQKPSLPPPTPTPKIETPTTPSPEPMPRPKQQIEKKPAKPIPKKIVKSTVEKPIKAAPKALPPKVSVEPEKPVSEDKKNAVKFSIGLKAGGIYTNCKEEIEVTTSNGGPAPFKFSQRFIQGGLILSCLVKERFLISGSYEKSFNTDLDINQFTLDFGVHFNRIDRLTPYATVGMIYGNLSWDEFPMAFNSELGWKIGAGGLFQIKKIQIGAEVGYQLMEYPFDVPAGTTISGGDTSVDLSGFLFSVRLQYQF